MLNLISSKLVPPDQNKGKSVVKIRFNIKVFTQLSSQSTSHQAKEKSAAMKVLNDLINRITIT